MRNTARFAKELPGMNSFPGGADLMLAAWAVEILFGYPDWLYRRIRHPVVWLGKAIGGLEMRLNKAEFGQVLRYGSGMTTTILIVALAGVTGLCVSLLMPASLAGFWVEAAIASSLISSRSLHEHVAAVRDSLVAKELDAARTAAGKIVGRETQRLPQETISSASIESLFENASDGVVAPLFWGALLGLPGIAAYKAINTLDSMLGHRNARFAAFGGFAARLDDVANFVPARLTALLVAAASLGAAAFRVMWRDASRHRSPNAGWPESAAAGALDIRLSGPRAYGETIADEPWLNADAKLPDPADLRHALALYRKTMLLGCALLCAAALPELMR